MSLSYRADAIAARCAPLPGTRAWYRQQVQADCTTLNDIARQLRTLAATLHPRINDLYFSSAPLAAFECCDTLTALAEEIEHDDTTTLTEAYSYSDYTGG